MTTWVPVFCCPKCGAVGDVTYTARREQAEYDAAVEDWKTIIDNAPFMALDIRSQLERVRKGIGGPWLDCGCPRCAHRWRERPLDTAAVAAESTTHLRRDVQRMTGGQCCARTYLLFTLGLAVVEVRWVWKTRKALRRG